MNNKTNIAAVLATIAVLILAAWLPGKFFTRPLEALTHNERVGLFRDFYLKRDTVDVSETNPDLVNIRGTITAARRSLDKLLEVLLIENGQGTVASGEMLYEIKGSDGREIRLWHVYAQWGVDWRNWMDAYVDIDSGLIYYLYISSGCTQNREKYRVPFNLPSNPHEAVTLWQELTEASVLTLSWSGVTGDMAEAVFDTNGDVSRYQIDCRYYVPASDGSDGLFEFKFLIQD